MARETALVVRPSSGVVARAALWLARSVGALIERPTEHVAGRDFSAPYGIEPTYEPIASMSAFAAFPWVYSSVLAKAWDLSGVPFVVRRGRGKDAQRLDAHPVLDLLDSPNTGTTARLFRMQLLVDLVLTGNAYVLLLSASRTRVDPAAIERLHPERVKIAPMANGRPEAYLYDAGGEIIRYAPEIVLHIRLPSWEAGPAGLYGTGAVQALHDELKAEQAASKRQATAASTGRPDAIAVPKETLSTAQAKEASENLNAVFKARHGGVAVVRNDFDVKPVGWSPAEMEFPEQRQLGREAVHAVIGTPPTRQQLPTANYAQSTDAMRQYWESLKAVGSLFCDAWTKLARMMPGGRPGDFVEMDFSEVSYLQEDRTSRLGRVTTHILHGMSPTDAYAYEGFEDAPIEDPEPPPPQNPSPPPGDNRPEDDADEDAPPAGKRAKARKDPMPRPQNEAERLAVWKGWAGRLQEPIERQLQLAAMRYLKGASQRYAAKVAAELAKEEQRATGTDGLIVRKDLTEALLIAIVGDRTEAGHLRTALGDVLTRAVERAFRATARQMGEELTWNPGASQAEQFLGELVTGVTRRTQDMVGEVVRRGLDAGMTAVDIARAVQSEAKIFGPSRAMNIARTESTRALNAGSTDAMSAAQRNGVNVRKEWLSSRDGHVREAHRALDGQVVPVGGKFIVPLGHEHAGASGAYPGDFSDPGMTCNCRCTVLPVVD